MSDSHFAPVRAIIVRPTAESRAGYTTQGRAQVRADPHLQLSEIKFAIAHLKAARECLKLAGAPKTLARVRLALTSAGGAARHARLAPYRNERRKA